MKNMFFMFFLNFFQCFFVFFKCRVFVVFISNMMHFSWAQTPFPGQSECFVAVLLTLFDSY